jgi:2-polyprenyl-3-methyl-5-hydroxy-6-metoxy-1,4-benzoquinol methylase
MLMNTLEKRYNRADSNIPAYSGLRVLVVIASHGFANDRHLARLIDEYGKMSFSVHVVVLSNVQRRIHPNVEVVVGAPCSDPHSLPFGHKAIFRNRSSEYDLFIYTEDDILITETNVEAFLRVSTALPGTELPGMIRFEKDAEGALFYPDVHRAYRWDIQSVRSRGDYTLAFFTNEHSGCYMLTRDQLRRAIASGGFLAGPRRTKYDMLETAATDIYTQCGLEKLIPISHLEDFLVHHLPNKYVGWMGVDDRHFSDQVQALLNIARRGRAQRPFLAVKSQAETVEFGKDYYESARMDLIHCIPEHAKTILSIGCGSGTTEMRLAEGGHRVVVLPADSVVSASIFGPNIQVINDDLEGLRRALGDKKVDCIVISDVLQLVESPCSVLSALTDVLARNGVLIVAVPKRTRLLKLTRSLRRLRWEWPSGHPKSGVHFTSRLRVRKWLRNSGFKISDAMELSRRQKWPLTVPILASLRHSEIIVAATADNT